MIKPTCGRVLAFDYGTKRIGVALGILETQIAQPLTTIHVKKNIPWNEIDTLMQAWKPKLLLIGTPLNMDGTEQAITIEARAFAKQLNERYHIAIEGVDERLSTRAARAELFEKGGYSSLQGGQVDAMAAKLLIVQWLLE